MLPNHSSYAKIRDNSMVCERMSLNLYTNHFLYLLLTILQTVLSAIKGKENICVDLQWFTSKQSKNVS